MKRLILLAAAVYIFLFLRQKEMPWDRLRFAVKELGRGTVVD